MAQTKITGTSPKTRKRRMPARGYTPPRMGTGGRGGGRKKK